MKYVVGVSGGIDSMVLLDMMSKDSTNEIIVAHVDHGVRSDSKLDLILAKDAATKYGFSFESTSLNLGNEFSESGAREMRYEWLNEIKQLHKADAIATAHHQDDVIETIIINLIRGTGWRGLSALKSGAIVRPLIDTSKSQIIEYAIRHGINWHEDSTNEDVRYLRNYVRLRFVQAMLPDARKEFIDLYKKQLVLDGSISQELDNVLPIFVKGEGLSRYQLIMAGREVSGEVICGFLGARLQTGTLTRIRHFVCTARPGKHYFDGVYDFRVSADCLFVSTSDI